MLTFSFPLCLFFEHYKNKYLHWTHAHAHIRVVRPQWYEVLAKETKMALPTFCRWWCNVMKHTFIAFREIVSIQQLLHSNLRGKKQNLKQKILENIGKYHKIGFNRLNLNIATVANRFCWFFSLKIISIHFFKS